ncbi:MAG: 1-acyl-sn-glycerol-3-phosphate acyltransferase [Actinomycetota bacterium]|nr:1-acyl-sn-glycerol-3-phosphate acyltransferase [Actinomycetota bacterium]
MSERQSWRKDWTFRLVARIAILVAWTLRWRFDTDGVEHVRERGGAVLAWNHHSYLDPGVIAWGPYRHLGRPVRFLAKEGLFDKPGLGWILRSSGQISVARASPAGRREAFEAAVMRLRAGELVAVAPEETISESFDLLPFTTGAVRMAQEADVPIVPTVAWGAHRVATKGRRVRLLLGLAVLVRYGRPRQVARDDDPEAATERLRETMAEMLDDVQRAYPVEPRPGEDWWVPRRLGGSAPPHHVVLRAHREREAEWGG